MRIEFWQPAGEHEQYAPHAFDGLIGQEAPFKIEGVERGQATVVAVEVAEDGRGATWTVDIAGDDAGKLAETHSGRRSFSFKTDDLPGDLFLDWP